MSNTENHPSERATVAALLFGAGGLFCYFGSAVAVSFGMAALFIGGLLYSAGVWGGETA